MTSAVTPNAKHDQLPPLASQLAKESLNRVEDLPLKDAYRLEQDYTLRISRFNDSAEARTAYQEKRTPNWTWT